MATSNAIKVVYQRMGRDAELTHEFETSRGSLYYRDKEGRTLRHKSYHQGHGALDQGWKTPSKATVYVNEYDAFHIAGTIQSTDWLFFDFREEKKGLYLVTAQFYPFKLEKIHGDAIPFETVPKIGLSPVELFGEFESDFGQMAYIPENIHVGNRIAYLESFE